MDDPEFPNITGHDGPAPMAVDAWTYNAAILYRSMDDIHSSQVTELSWYKNDEGLEHEFVVATCRRDRVMNDIILRFDRWLSQAHGSLDLPGETAMGLQSAKQYRSPKDNVQFERNIPNQIHWTTALRRMALTMIIRMEKDLHSVDTVTRLPGPEGLFGDQGRLVRRYHIFERPFYVRDLAFLANTISGCQPKRLTSTNQLQWYARTLLIVAADVYRPSIIDGRVPISVSKERQDEVDDIRKIFEDSLRDHDSRVNSKLDEHREELSRIRETLRIKLKLERKLENPPQPEEARRQLAQESCLATGPHTPVKPHTPPNLNIEPIGEHLIFSCPDYPDGGSGTSSFSKFGGQASSSHWGRIIESDFSRDALVSGTVDGKILEDFEATTCWFAAERALKQVRRNTLQLAEVFSRQGFRKPDYVVLAGFDESLIRAGVGYLEQIHVFVSAEVDAGSPLLPELGKIFSPFSSILFTESSSHHIPVFKEDESLWEFDELVHFTASKFADGGAGAAMPPTVISLSPTPSPAENLSSFSQPNSGSGEQGGSKKRSSNKGKKRAQIDDDEGDNEDEDDKVLKPNPPPGGPDLHDTASHKIFFDVTSEMRLIPGDPNVLQSLMLEGCLTIEMEPLDPERPDEFSKCRIQFDDLRFGTAKGAYKQHHIRIAINSGQKNARILGFNPRRTTLFEREEMESSGTKRARIFNMIGGFAIGLKTQVNVGGGVTSSKEKSTGSEKKRFTTRITQESKDGVNYWGFDIDDPHEQERGMDMTNTSFLPIVRFAFIGSGRLPPAPPPEEMDTEITSTWSILPNSGDNKRKKNWWAPKWLEPSTPSDNNQTPSYSNICQILALKMAPSNLPKEWYYKATLRVKPQNFDDPDIEVAVKTDSSAEATPAIPRLQDYLSDNPQMFCAPMLPRLTNLTLSDQTLILENSSSSKSH